MERGLHTDDSGNFIVLDALIQDCPFLLVNIYLPTKPAEQTNFFDKIKVSSNSTCRKLSRRSHCVAISMQLLILN